MKFVSNVTNLKQSSNTKHYIVFDSGLQKNTAFTFEVETNRIIPVKSTYELLEKKKVKTSLTGEYDIDNFDFMNLPLKDLVTKDVPMLKLSIPNITFLTPVYSDGKKEDHLFCSNIPIHNRQSVILYQNKRETNA